WLHTMLFSAWAVIVCPVVAHDGPVTHAKHVMLEKEVTELQSHDEAVQAAGKPGPWRLPEGLEVGALVETEASYSHTPSDDEEDLSLATVELFGGWQVVNWLRGDLVLLYEEDNTEPMDVDQAIVTFGDTEVFPLYVQAGKQYVPFGHLDSQFVSDPIVLELSESQETAALLGVEHRNFNASASVYDGDVETDGDNTIENAVLATSYGFARTNSTIHFGGAWIRNIMDSDGLTGVLEDADYAYTDHNTGGLDVWATATYGDATLITEYVTAVDEIHVDGVDTGLKPSSMNLELGYGLTERVEVAGKYEHADDVADWFAENRYGAVGRVKVLENDWLNVGVALEYMREDFDEGAEDADVVTLQLSIDV
ncbi:MAG: LbtU family siderophore porin, partial [Kiritimatiellaceae bacterium]|nr:LbtU family siderophore porin [Kiritimatiellaceae bacterium]